MSRVSSILIGLLLGGVALATTNATSPGRAPTGPGSTDAYVASQAQVFRSGRASQGRRVLWFVPDTLRDGSSAPVVVFLHGFSASNPNLYRDHVEHLLAQGYIVIFPQFNRSGLLALFSDTDQNAFLARAIASTERALDRLGPLAQRDQVYLYGHSLGGLLAYAWSAAGGPEVQGAVLANASFAGNAALPAFVQAFVTIDPIDWAAAAPAIDVPLVLLTGTDDDIAAPGESYAAADAATNAPARTVWTLSSDDHGTPALSADHLAPLTRGAGIPDLIWGFFGAPPTDDTFDQRAYQAALDALIGGDIAPSPDLGAWSDGTPVLAPAVLP